MKRSTAPRHVISLSQPRAQGLDQHSEAASVLRPANVLRTHDEDEQDLPPRRASAREPPSPSPPSLQTNERNTPEGVYWIDWIVCLGKEVFHTGVVSSEQRNVGEYYCGMSSRIRETFDIRGKGGIFARPITALPIVVNAKGMKTLWLSITQLFCNLVLFQRTSMKRNMSFTIC
jgi:hypothetical protein